MRIFDPGGAFGDDPVNGVASVSVVSNTIPTLALDLSVGPPQVSLAQPSATMEAGATEWVLCLVTLQDLASGYPVDPKQYPVSVAITQADPLPSDWQAGIWLARSADPAGAYAMVLAGPGGAVNPAVGRWRVYVQIQAGGENLEERAAGQLTVE